MQKILLILAVLLAPPARADTTHTMLSTYDGTVRKVYAKESKSQCLARARRTLDEIVVCGQVERNDRFRLQKSGTIILEQSIILSPAERALATQSLINQSKSAIGTGYTSSLAGIESGYVRRSYKVATNMFKGQDPDLE